VLAALPGEDLADQKEEQQTQADLSKKDREKYLPGGEIHVCGWGGAAVLDETMMDKQEVKSHGRSQRWKGRR
jgi:hypothetical protein